MKLPSTSIRDKRGFTLIEILVVIALITVIASIGIMAGIDSYQRFLFRSNVDTAVSLLQKARSSAIHNMNETSHGVYFCDPSNSKFVLFRTPSDYVSRDIVHDFNVEKSKAVTITSCSTPDPDEIVFTQLSATTTPGNITLSDGVRNALIEINYEGGINW